MSSSTLTPQLSVNLLGRPGVAAGGSPVPLSPGATMLCAYLALAPPEGRPRAVAAAHLFAACTEPLARRRLNTALWRLKAEVRSGTGLDVVAACGPRTIALSPDVAVSTDAAAFQSMIESVVKAPPAAMDDAAARHLEQAIALRRGRLVETCEDEWILAARYRIDHLYLTALDYLVQYYGVRGNALAVATYGEHALDLEPLREDLHRHLISAYGAAGRMDLAERQFEQCRRVLLEELGADPMPETVATYARLRGRGGAVSTTVVALVAELERARRDITRLASTVDRTLDQLRHMPSP